LYSDLIEHWEKRSLSAVDDYDPRHLDRDRLVAALREHGGERLAEVARSSARRVVSGAVHARGLDPRRPAGAAQHRDARRTSRAGRISTKRDIRDHFVPNFFFGCEAEDPSIAWSLDGKLPMEARLQVMFGSDIGTGRHRHCARCLAEAYEAGRRRARQPEDFRMFTFGNVVRLHGAHTRASFAKRVSNARPPQHSYDECSI